MKKNELQLILEEGEGYKIEFKETINNIDKAMIAFANSSGGKIIIGVNDNGEIKGISFSNRMKSQIQDIANSCRPKVQVFLEKVENVVVVTVREGMDKPYECSSGFYKRIGPNSQKMTRNEILESFKSEGKIRFDELVEPKFKYSNDFDRTRLQKFLEFAGLSKTIKPETILTNLGVAEKQEGDLYFNNSGVLFFGKEPQQFVPWSVFTVVLFKDYNGVDVIDRKEVTGSLFEIVNQVMDFIRLYSKVAYRFTGKPQREEIYEYPFDAIREAVINSVMHKDYFEHGHNNILKFFPDRIQIENIWVKPKGFIPGKTVFRRNHLIADLFSRIHFGERLGSGMQRMRDICKNENAPYPEIDFTDTHFYITFKQNKEYLKLLNKKKFIVKDEKVSERIKVAEHEAINEAINEATNEAINEAIKNRLGGEILYLIQQDFFNLEILMDTFNLSRSTAQRDISILKSAGFIKFSGAKKTGKYILTNKGKDIFK